MARSRPDTVRPHAILGAAAARSLWHRAAAGSRARRLHPLRAAMGSAAAQIGKERQDLARESLNLCRPFLIGADEVEHDVPGASGMEAPDAFGDLLGPAERRIALGGAAEIHCIAAAQALARRVERPLVAVVEPREQQMPGTEALDAAAGLLRRRGNLVERGAVRLGRDDV